MGQHELLLYGKILLPALALLVILFIIGKVRSIRRNKQIEEQFSEKEAAQTKKPVNSCGASSRLNSAQIESVNRKLQKQYDSKRNPGKLILLLIIGVIVCLFIASKTEFYILIPIFLVAFFVILIVYSIVSALLYRRNKVNNFYSELLPNVLADAFADYKPQMMQKPSPEFFEAPIAYNLLSPMTYGVLTFENSSFLSTAFFCVSREYNPPRSAGETDPRFRESYTINQGITFNITPKNSFSPNCKILIKSKAQQESVIISAAEMTSPPCWCIKE